jgi:hypothetical protein
VFARKQGTLILKAHRRILYGAALISQRRSSQMIIKLIGVIYGRHSTIYRRMIDEKESKKRG